MATTLNDVIAELEQAREAFGGDTAVVATIEDFEGEGDVIALDQLNCLEGL